jgi:hypothetical protein
MGRPFLQRKTARLKCACMISPATSVCVQHARLSALFAKRRVTDQVRIVGVEHWQFLLGNKPVP